MNVIRLLCVCAVLACTAIPSFDVYAAKKPTNQERKEYASNEYELCMAIAKEVGVEGVIEYVKKEQAGTSLIGSPAKLAQENCIADSLELPRYENIDQIINDTKLVFVESPLIRIKDDVPHARHVALPATRDFLIELATYMEHATASNKVSSSNEQILVSSLVRSHVDQKTIARGGRSFADCLSSAVCSTHLTGATADISLRYVDKKRRAILTARLLEDREKGHILVILEKAGNHFHVFVIPTDYHDTILLQKIF